MVIIMQDTIAAVSTAMGKGGIAVIRISGERAVSVADKMFKPLNGKSLLDAHSSSAVYGNIYFEGNKIDDGVVTIFRSPRSFTGEDTVEISCHGGILLQEKVLRSALKSGARMAEAGEFTKRAFINGKISLSEAEAVISKINAESEEQLKLAVSHADGKLKNEMNSIINALVKVLSSCYVLCDYPDEDLSEISTDEIISTLENCIERCDMLIKSYKTGHAVAEGIPTVIVGQPNTGKSSLLNAFLGYDRAIVTDIAGTTRDVIEERVYVGRVTLSVADTAGIRFGDGVDTVEKLGVSRSIEKLKNAELALAVFDGSKEFSEQDNEIISVLKRFSCPKIAVINKSDLGIRFDTSLLKETCDKTVEISALSQKGIENLISAIEDMYFDGEIDYNQTPVLALARQKNSVSLGREHIQRALNAIRLGISPDMAGFDIEDAIAEFEALDGRRVSEMIVSQIFSGFCVGK